MEEKDAEKNPKEHDVQNDTEQRSTEEPESEPQVICYLEDEVASAKSICNLDLPSAPTDR